ncbi:unnamed protein product [Rhizoctonia solani]|uniref:Caspase family p20 domain-containing protein n=1 Tax=Rhizoctonia solani TaxID=456999 RepID=A0A8H2XVI2_9AGAM|nr:unnamed protein product [Rhizoctonia solani]
MPLSPPEAPVVKGRKSGATRWLDILPTGPPLNTEQELRTQHLKTDTRPDHSRSQGVAAPVIPASGQRQHYFLQPRASQPHAPRPQTPFTHPQPPLGRPHTPLDRTLTLSGRPQTPSSRPQTPRTQVSLGKQRPPSISIPSQSRTCGGVIAYNPEESPQVLDFSPPIPRGRRNEPVQALSSHDMLPRQLSPSIAPRGPVARGSKTPSRDTTYMSIPRCERGLLIIGSSHRDPTTYAAKFPPLRGIQNDRDRLRTAFQSRKYSVETMVEEEGNKSEILRRVGNFLASAEGGDIRMIVFTGHGDRIGTDQQFVILPWGCSSEDDTITSAEWKRIVLENAGAGVVVVSVFATCMSGAVMEESEKLTNFDRIIERQSLAPDLPNGPIHIILSSSGDTQSSFEYHTPSHHSGSTTWHDYFLWALAETIQRAEVDSWELFVKTLQTTFNYVRTAGFRNSSFQYPEDLEWLLHHPQTPHISVSSRMPAFDRFLPPMH